MMGLAASINHRTRLVHKNQFHGGIQWHTNDMNAFALFGMTVDVVGS